MFIIKFEKLKDFFDFINRQIAFFRVTFISHYTINLLAYSHLINLN
jgi:hypothetical protein